MHRIAAVLVAFIACAGVPAAAQLPQAFARAGVPFELSADSLEYHANRNLYVARGSVFIRQGDQTLSADWMAFSKATGRGVASGNVVFTDECDTVYTSFVEFDVTNLEGVLFDARFESEEPQFRLEGAEIAKTGERDYSFKDGMFTTCRCPDEGRDPWRIRASEADLEIGGYGTARNTTFDILGVPVVWLPWMIYPLKTERQTGFLLPEFDFGSRNGPTAGLPFFWAAADRLNVTLTPRWLQKRGVKGDVDLEFVLGERSEGWVFGSFIHDEDIDANSPEEPFDRERWAVRGRQNLFLPHEVRFKADFGFASDNNHPFDFPELSGHRNDRFLESRAFATKHLGATGQYGLMGSAAYADDLQSPDNLDRDKFLLQRLPQVELAALPGPLRWASRIVPALDVRYTHFRPRRRAEEELGVIPFGDDLFLDTGIDAVPGSVDDVFENDGAFQEGEPLADRGHRVVLAPRLGMPWRVGDLVEIYPEVGWHETLYATRAQSFEERGLLTGRVDLRTRLRRRFGASATHLLEPRLGWALVTKDGQSGKPLFVPPTAVPQERIRQLQLENVVRDPADRIGRFHGLTFGFDNRVYGGMSPRSAPRLLADFSLSGGYEFYEDEFGLVLLDGRVYPWEGVTARFSLGFDPEAGRVDEGLASLIWSSAAGHRAVIGYRYLRGIPRFFEDFELDEGRFEDFDDEFDRVNQGNLALRVAITERWSATYNVAYTFEQSHLLANRGSIEYLSRCRCWAAGVEVRQDRVRGVQFGLIYRLVGLGNDERWPGGGVGSTDRSFLDVL